MTKWPKGFKVTNSNEFYVNFIFQYFLQFLPIKQHHNIN